MTEEEHHKDDDAFGLGCAMEYFTDHAEVIGMLDNLHAVLDEPTSNIERAYERFVVILKQYHEQPHLLDTHLESILDKMIGIIRDPSNSMRLKHATFKYMFVVTNVRGYKVIVRQLPHEVADFEPVLRLLEAQQPDDVVTWESRYILLLWMSIIVMIPFHMSRLDGFDVDCEEHKPQTVMQRVLHVCKTYIVQSDKCRDAAAFLISKFLTRTDVKMQHMDEFFTWACDLSTSKESSSFVKYGTLSSIAMILKHGKREDLLPHAQKLLSWIIDDGFKQDTGSNIQKLIYKIVQRIGLVFLPPKVAKWRYQRGNRSLAANLCGGDAAANTNIPKITPGEDDVHVDVPEEIEEIIDQLVQGLKSGDSVVRWSAAKGVGRVTGRLPKDFADDVVGSILELFSPREGDGAWHGGCLALAELGRRGLLLPGRLPEVVPVIMQALVYDEPRGYASIGSHIRDAACYVCWSFARAYATEDLQPFVNIIAGQLLVVTCFDREINCRRAASAAFQENVGRQGTFPHGIDILTVADFFAVSVRTNAFLTISLYIAKFDEYRMQMIDHLVERKVPHWDIAMRELATKALHNMTVYASDHIGTTVLDDLFKKTTSIDINTRHGAVSAIGDIFLALARNERTIAEVSVDRARKLIGGFREKLYFRGMGGELMKLACCRFIQNCSEARLPFHGETIVEEWLTLLNECLSYDMLNIRLEAVLALPKLLETYFADNPEKQERVVLGYIQQLTSDNLEIVRMGHSLALGALPGFILAKHASRIISALLDTLIITANTLKWSESRRDAIKALTGIVTNVELTHCLADDHVLKIYQAFLNGLNEYTQDKRGDIGAWVREASMTGLQVMTLHLCDKRVYLFTPVLVERVVVSIAQQAVEKIDRTRALAGRAFYKLIQSNLPNIPNHGEIKELFQTTDSGEQLNWNSASVTFPIFVQLIKFPKYTYNVLLGFVCSIGGLTETLVKSSSQSLFVFLDEVLSQPEEGNSELVRICDVVLQIFSDFQKVDRIAVPMLKFLEKVFSSGRLGVIIEDEQSEYAKKFLKLTLAELNGCKDIYKLNDVISFLCQYVQIKGEITKTALVQLTILLCHRQPYVRKSTANKLFEAIIIYGDNSIIPADNLDEVQNLLSGTNWEEPVDDVRPVRNAICTLMGTRVPVPKSK